MGGRRRFREFPYAFTFLSAAARLGYGLRPSGTIELQPGSRIDTVGTREPQDNEPSKRVQACDLLGMRNFWAV